MRAVVDSHRRGCNFSEGAGYSCDRRNAGCLASRNLFHSCFLRRNRALRQSLQQEDSTCGSRGAGCSERTDRMNSKRTLIAIASLLLISGCKVGPNYQRPAVTVPPQYRGVAPDLTNQPAAASFAEMKWPSVFQDDVLKGLIQEALTNNYDIRIAASRILQAEANVGIVRSNQLPTLNGAAGVENQRNAVNPGAPTFDTVGLQLNYVL